jgi:hypothetical protein
MHELDPEEKTILASFNQDEWLSDATPERLKAL